MRVAIGFAVRGRSRCEVRAKLVLGAGVVLGRRLDGRSEWPSSSAHPHCHCCPARANLEARAKPSGSLPNFAHSLGKSMQRLLRAMPDDAQRPSVHVQRTLPPAIACHSRRPSLVARLQRSSRPRLQRNLGSAPLKPHARLAQNRGGDYIRSARSLSAASFRPSSPSPVCAGCVPIPSPCRLPCARVELPCHQHISIRFALALCAARCSLLATAHARSDETLML